VNAHIWDDRAQAYRESEAHSHGADLDLLVEWAAGARTALDVGSGGGHVARRLREAGLEVVTVDPAPGMRADVQAFAEELPFADASFDLVACRAAVHHFADVEAGVREMARVAGDRLIVVDNLFMGVAAEEAEIIRDPAHVRNYSEEEWRGLLAGAGLRVAEVRTLVHAIDLAAWLDRTGCTGRDAERVRELLAGHIEGDRVGLERIVVRAEKER
jgi:SAM-dependent methyltransferase